MRLLPLGTSVLVLTACAQVPGLPGRAAPAPDAVSRAAGLWGPKAPLRAGVQGGPIRVGLASAYIKDPSFVADGAAVGGARWLAFGDLRTLYLKAFDVGGEAGPLVFRAGELPIAIDGLPAGIDSPWAPQIVVVRDRAVLLHCAGAMPAPEPPRWGTFRLRLADMPLAAFEAALRAGQAPRFADRGAILDDLAPFGAGDRDYGAIDPHLFVNDRGRAYMTYTLVRAGVPGKRPHEEFVRARRVDPQDPARPLGPETPLYDGTAGGDADGVAEAQDVATIGGKTYAFVSIRPGDVDQRLLVAEVPRDLGPVKADAFKPFRYAGAEPWMAKAVGSSAAATIGRTTYLVHQGLGADGRFTIGWTTVVQP